MTLQRGSSSPLAILSPHEATVDYATGIVTPDRAKKPRKKPSNSPTKLSLALLRADGWECAIVEHWNAYARVRVDLFGFIDILCLRGTETLAVQATSDDNLSKRVAKIGDSPLVGIVRKAGWRIVAHGWRKKGARWQVREIDLS